MIEEIAWRTWLDFSCFCGMVRVLLPDIGLPVTIFLSQGSTTFPQELHIGTHVECEAVWEYAWRHSVAVASDHSIHYDVDWTFDFFLSLLAHILRLTPKHSEISISELTAQIPSPYSMLFPNFWHSEWRHSAVSLTYGTQLTPLHCVVDSIKNKRWTCTKL